MRITKSKIQKRQNELPLIERDISWMYFNYRILQEARRTNVPILERLNFLGIYSNNLDEFYRVRVATLSRIAELKNNLLKKESEKAQHTIKQINKLNSKYSTEYTLATHEVVEQLAKCGVCIVNDQQINTEQQTFIRQYFQKKIKGLTFPIWLSIKGEQLTNETDEAIYLAIKMHYLKNGKERKNYALIQLPVKTLGRFLRLPDGDGKNYLMYLDDVVRYCLPYFFIGLPYEHFEAYAFKFTKDAEMEMDDDLDSGKMQKVQKGVKSRKRGEPLRVLYDADMPKDLLKRVMNKLNLDHLDTSLASGRYHNHKDLINFPDCGRLDLKYPVWEPLLQPEFSGKNSVLDIIHKSDQFVHLPYHSFDAYLSFLGEAAINPKVKAIKITLYRLAKVSKVVKTLIAAVKNGKKVTVVIELLARFDEANNISWSQKMQDSGIKVVFGVEGLKIHSKITLIEMSQGNIACIGTGNLHEGNARIYTDCMLFTASKTITQDVEKVFDFIQTPFAPIKFRELLVSPNDMKRQILHLINNEIKNKRIGKNAYIQVKINHVTDTDIIRALYAASEEGVQVDMIIRGNCSIITDLPRKSENIHIHGIIDRYLEHSRILIFCNGGDERYYIGSADWMPRNLENRIEVMTPIYNMDIQKELKRIVEYGLRDTAQGRIVNGNGDNEFYSITGKKRPFRSQEELYKYYKQKINKNGKQSICCN